MTKFTVFYYDSETGDWDWDEENGGLDRVKGRALQGIVNNGFEYAFIAHREDGEWVSDAFIGMDDLSSGMLDEVEEQAYEQYNEYYSRDNSVISAMDAHEKASKLSEVERDAELARLNLEARKQLQSVGGILADAVRDGIDPKYCAKLLRGLNGVDNALDKISDLI